MIEKDGFLIIESESELLELAIANEIETIDEYHVKHDITHYTSVFEYGNKFWIVNYNRSYTNGVEFYREIKCPEAERREVTLKKWMPKEVK